MAIRAYFCQAKVGCRSASRIALLLLNSWTILTIDSSRSTWTMTKRTTASTTSAGFRTANIPRELANAEADIGESRGTTQSKNGLPISRTITSIIISVASTTKNTPLVCITSTLLICLATMRNSTMYLTMNRMNSFSKESCIVRNYSCVFLLNSYLI